MTRDEILNMPANLQSNLFIGKKFFPEYEYNGENFTGNMTHAWALKAKIGLPISLVESMLGGDFSCEFLLDVETEKTVEATADTAPLAICRAALLAVMEAE